MEQVPICHFLFVFFNHAEIYNKTDDIIENKLKGEAEMDEILKLWTPKIKLFGRETKEILLVLAGLAVLCLCVDMQGEPYAGNMELSENEIKASAVKISEVDSGIQRELEEIRTGMPTREIGTLASGNISVPAGKINIPDDNIAEYKTEERAVQEGAITPVLPEMPAEIIPTGLKVCVYGNGGVPEYTEGVYKMDEFAMDQIEEPRRAGKVFDGWYEDAACTIPFDTFSGEEDTLILYAGWAEFPGVICDDNGYITGCTGSVEAVADGILILPCHEDCSGIRKGALENVREEIFEICIPSNITYIEPGAFAELCNLLYIEVLPGNPAYYSEEGILYHKNGTVAVYPQGRLELEDFE